MATTSRFGQVGPGTEGFSVRMDLRGRSDIIALVDRVTHNFRGGTFQQTVASVNERAAIQVQEAMVVELRHRIRQTRRLQTRGERLELSLLDERNRDVTASSMIVGRESWLDESPAQLYWRQIDEGNPMEYDWRAFFTNDFNNFYGPWSSGGTERQSQLRHTRSGGATKLYSRKAPPGYKHSRMPQSSTGVAMNVGPFPAYRYSAAGAKALRRFPFKAEYQKALANVGLSLT